MLDNNQWLGLGIIAGIAYLVDNDYRGGKEYGAESFEADGKYTNNQISKMNYREITDFDELLSELIYDEMYDNFDGDNFSTPYKAWKGLDIKDRKKIISKISKDKRYKEYNKVKRIDDSSDNKRGKVLKVGELKEALKNANDNDEVCVGSLYDENAIVPSNRVYKKGKEVIISGNSGYHVNLTTQQALEDADNYSRKYSAESFNADWGFYDKVKLRCAKCGDEGGMTHLMKGLKDVWDNVGYDDYESIYCPMCGKGVELVIPEGYDEYGNKIYDAESKCDRLWDCKTCERCKSHCGCGNDRKLRRTNMRKMYGKNIYNLDTLCGHGAESFEAEKINTFSEIENKWKDSSVTIYDEDADEFYGVKEILVQEGDDVLEDGHPYLVLNKDSGDLDSQVFYRDFQTGYDAESFE